MKKILLFFSLFVFTATPVSSQEYLIHESTGLKAMKMSEGETAVLIYEDKYDYTHIYIM